MPIARLSFCGDMPPVGRPIRGGFSASILPEHDLSEAPGFFHPESSAAARDLPNRVFPLSPAALPRPPPIIRFLTITRPVPFALGGKFMPFLAIGLRFPPASH